MKKLYCLKNEVATQHIFLEILLKVLIYINPFVSNAPFLYPLKTSENRKVFWCFQRVKKVCVGNKWLKERTLFGWKVYEINLLKEFLKFYNKINLMPLFELYYCQSKRDGFQYTTIRFSIYSVQTS